MNEKTQQTDEVPATAVFLNLSIFYLRGKIIRLLSHTSVMRFPLLRIHLQKPL